MNFGLNWVVFLVLWLVLVFLERKCLFIEGVSFEDYCEGDVDLCIYILDDIKYLVVFVWIYGGGMVVGFVRNLMDYSWCGELVLELGIRVFFLNYWLVLEYLFFVSLDDCYEVWWWLLGKVDYYGIDMLCIVIGGESVGGNYIVGFV